MRCISYGFGNLASPIILIDDCEFFVRRQPDPAAGAEMLQKAVLEMSATKTTFEVESNREFRRRNQPFYRGLKKYRKP